MTRLLPLVALLALACHESTPAPIVCEIAQSPNACLRCQAQRCGSELDRCYGPGFHEGRAIGPSFNQRCQWNPDTGKYDRNCVFSGGLSTKQDGGFPAELADVPCGQMAACVQSCGCGADCQASCGGDAGRTLYFANDPRDPAPLCNDCQRRYLSACVAASCAADCAPPDAGP